MKRILLLMTIPAIIFFASCGGSKVEEEVILPGMMKVEFAVAGDTLSMIVPDSSKGKLDLIEQGWGATELRIGENFQISVEEGEGDIAMLKNDIDIDDVYQLQKYVVDQPDLLFWESKIPIMPTSNFHFYSIIQAGGKSYIVKDIEAGIAYSEELVKEMVEAAKSLKSKNKTAASH